jgi:hypothetical protein
MKATVRNEQRPTTEPSREREYILPEVNIFETKSVAISKSARGWRNRPSKGGL